MAAAFATLKTKSATSCAAGAAPATPGILEVPAIGLVAPVLEGLSDNVLNVAVGHVPGTPVPGAAGEAMVEAHDVSYFSNLSAVRPGDQVVYLTACLRSTFRVIASKIEAPGAIVYPPTGGAGLALVTCWPTNALFWTSQRFLVTTRLTSVSVTNAKLPKVKPAIPRFDVPAPAALVRLGLALNENSLPLGVLSLTGSPSSQFRDGPAPLIVERYALEEFFGAEKAAAAGNRTWWNDLTLRGVPFWRWPSFGVTNITINVSGSTARSVVFRSGAASVTVEIADGRMLISKITS